MNEYQRRTRPNIKKMAENKTLKKLTKAWFIESARNKYSYHFTWLGRPVIQYPQDILAIQELIWNVKPDLIVETGIAHGGSLILSASILQMIGGEGKVIGIDVDIREHNRVAIEEHALYHRLELLEGSSIDPDIIEAVKKRAAGKKVMVFLDSNHTESHVSKELALYSPIVSKASYLVVFDTIIEDMPDDFFHDRPWGIGNNPNTAVLKFLEKNNRFEIDKEMENKLLITVAPNGYLKCIKD